ncbi:RNA polymerase sigma-70 factor [Paenibacillus whitsoniae]|uniref:RNA polymerase sigma-70 factor n=1 Tax=Paenibacillus whitsoniae TaxID=2496558 RepID=A0A3S0C7T9_9BACL|nr:RNA polymerase sigma-70 factor [Paenibacillus whitsoniae]
MKVAPNEEGLAQSGAAGALQELYDAYKPLVFSLAYRMLGSVMDAEDVVQETFLYINQQLQAGTDIRTPKAYLCKIATNKCIDKLRASSAKRETYVGPWLPEPLLTEASTPDGALSHKESLGTAYLLLLQQLSWVERAVFVLREVLQYEYDEIADIVGKSPANTRQIFHRAKKAISGQDAGGEAGEGTGRQASPPSSTTAQVVEQFVQALVSGNVQRLLSMMKQDAVLYSDGGGKVQAAVRPILGAERIIAFITGVLAKVPEGYRFSLEMVNGQLGITGYIHEEPYHVTTFHLKGEQIEAVYLVANPNKLRHLAGRGQT